jgi:SPP1 gp7 family putative phage head morphogenesis protein
VNARAAHTARALQVHRRIGTAGARRRLPRQVPPLSIERDYAGEIQRLVDVARAVLRPLEQALPHLLAAAARERRHDAGEGSEIRKIIESARRHLTDTVTPQDVERLARLFAERTATYQRIQLNSQVHAALGVDLFVPDTKLAAILDGFVAENAALITSVPAQVIDRIEGRVTRAVTDGTLHDDLAADLQKEYGFGERRAALIARDQIGKAYGQVNASRQRDLGVERYRWVTSRDERVRPEHRALDGLVFRYDDPTGGDHGMVPGQPILCRCMAEPIFDEILAATE